MQMKNKNPVFFEQNGSFSSSSEYLSSSSSTISNKSEVENKTNQFPEISFQYTINENDYLSEDQFNQMQDEILKSGQQLEPLIQSYVQNHKKSSAYLPICSLFDLFKRELKMNLVIRQNLIKERSIKQEIINSLDQLKNQKNDFFLRISQKVHKDITSYEEVETFISQNNDSPQDNFKHEKKTFLKEIKTLKEANEHLTKQNTMIQNSFNDKEKEKSIEISQYLSTIQNSKNQIQKFEFQFKNLNFQISDLKAKLEKKKQKISMLKNNLTKLNASNDEKIKPFNENLLKYEQLINDLNLEKEQLKRENEEQFEKHKETQSELEILQIKIKKMESIENENSTFKQTIKELKNSMKENDDLIQKHEALCEKDKKHITRLKRKINRFRNLLKDLSSQLNQKIDDIEKANQTITKLNSKIGKLQNIHSIEIDLIKTQHLEQSKQTNDKLIILEEKFHLIKKNYSFCNDENKRLQYQLNQASKDINRLEKENAQLLAKLEKISMLNENQDDINDYQDDD